MGNGRGPSAREGRGRSRAQSPPPLEQHCQAASGAPSSHSSPSSHSWPFSFFNSQTGKNTVLREKLQEQQ